MEEESFVFTTNGEHIIKALAEARKFLEGSPLLSKLDEVISEELDLALIAVKKAKSEVIKSDKNNIRPIK